MTYQIQILCDSPTCSNVATLYGPFHHDPIERQKADAHPRLAPAGWAIAKLSDIEPFEAETRRRTFCSSGCMRDYIDAGIAAQDAYEAEIAAEQAAYNAPVDPEIAAAEQAAAAEYDTEIAQG